MGSVKASQNRNIRLKITSIRHNKRGDRKTIERNETVVFDSQSIRDGPIIRGIIQQHQPEILQEGGGRSKCHIHGSDDLFGKDSNRDINGGHKPRTNVQTHGKMIYNI